MTPEGDSSDTLLVMDDIRLRLRDMSKKVLDKSYGDVNLRAPQRPLLRQAVQAPGSLIQPSGNPDHTYQHVHRRALPETFRFVDLGTQRRDGCCVR